MLLTLRLSFADRPEHELAVDSAEAGADPWEMLRSLADRDGWVALGDRDSFRIDEVVDLRLVEPRSVEGPGWRGDLQDEDAAAALDENYDAPR